MRAAIGRLQSSERIAERLRKSEADPKQYFTTLFERSKKLVASAAEPNGFNPRTVAAGLLHCVLGDRAQDLHAERGGGNTRDTRVYRQGVLQPEAERGVRDPRRTAGSAR